MRVAHILSRDGEARPRPGSFAKQVCSKLGLPEVARVSREAQAESARGFPRAWCAPVVGGMGRMQKMYISKKQHVFTGSGNLRFKLLGVAPFFPGILLSRKWPETQGKRPVLGKNAA